MPIGLFNARKFGVSENVGKKKKRLSFGNGKETMFLKGPSSWPYLNKVVC